MRVVRSASVELHIAVPTAHPSSGSSTNLCGAFSSGGNHVGTTKQKGALIDQSVTKIEIISQKTSRGTGVRSR